MLESAGVPAPDYGTAHGIDEAVEIAGRIGYPVLVRPSYVLGGRGMEIVYSREQPARLRHPHGLRGRPRDRCAPVDRPLPR
ncbi:hypothetical protein GCM10025876_38820 [Demequina litorisediminis]|uniref:Carbamoyl phosphate synthase ATP-binding domain-containing protein n=1 Tax=Demequina litorisediminis TaxID=1849022 RepID=A0ABQ6IKJ9_9MICO|nr:hypothetical protein GCM10025876_38820 [Demequina litorisediminis]